VTFVLLLGNHWDDVIVQYKELELANYKVPAEVTEILKKTEQRIEQIVARPFTFLSPHVIELSEKGYIGEVARWIMLARVHECTNFCRFSCL
jgi:hypothetical protein